MTDQPGITLLSAVTVLCSTLILLTGVISPAHPQPNILTAHFHLRTNENDIPYLKLTSVKSPHKTDCAHTCSVGRGCKAFVYNTKTGMCNLHDVGLSVSHSPHVEGKMYSIINGVNDRNTLKTGANCTVNRPSCFSGTCCCDVGWNYDPKSHQCVKGCKKYGSKMTVYKGYGLLGNNDEVFRDITLQQCEQKCVTLKKFICRTFDYGKEAAISLISNGCMLSRAGFFDIPPDARKKTNHWIIGVRNCQP